MGNRGSRWSLPYYDPFKPIYIVSVRMIKPVVGQPALLSFPGGDKYRFQEMNVISSLIGLNQAVNILSADLGQVLLSDKFDSGQHSADTLLSFGHSDFGLDHLSQKPVIYVPGGKFP